MLQTPKSKINLTFIFHLVESQTRGVGGWGPMFGTKSQIKPVFLGAFPYEIFKQSIDALELTSENGGLQHKLNLKHTL